ncbi:hypothetical protein Pmani_040242, partial [Petrolisthes manimaculis]
TQQQQQQQQSPVIYIDPPDDHHTEEGHADEEVKEVDEEEEDGRSSLLSNEDRPDSVFRAKSRVSRPVTTEVDYDTDEGGVYRSKSRADYSKGIQEVLESSQTHVDLPLDMVEAREVQEEMVAA